MKPVLMGRAGRWVIGLIAGMAMGMTSSGMVDEWSPGGATAEKFGQNIMKIALTVKTATSIDILNSYKFYLRDAGDRMAVNLGELKYKVTAIRSEISTVDDAIAIAWLERGDTSDEETIALLRKRIENLRGRRKQLAATEAESYKTYARYRGRCVVAGLLFGIIVQEADKRIAELGNNTAQGTWAGTYTGEDGKGQPQSGIFSLLIDPQTGAITGGYQEGGEEVAVSGRWDPKSGACEGKGSDPTTPAAFGGTLTRGEAGYSGGGTFSYKHKDGGSGGGAWTTR